MPKSKEFVDSSGSASDSDEGPKTKKPKKVESKGKKPEKSPSKSGSSSDPKRDDEGNAYWEIKNNVHLKVKKFKGKTYVDVREYYEKEGKTLPGKKGICLNLEAWDLLKQHVDDVDDAIRHA